jgi:hypothetical protein
LLFSDNRVEGIPKGSGEVWSIQRKEQDKEKNKKERTPLERKG